ncbi:hypothetical protein GGS26DRAFT_486893 [Hypomontagnella submonticulosa]|nr:hypothetical protein GGS26DRAFT_486893 [Hypomontagnella submonticulosa]
MATKNTYLEYKRDTRHLLYWMIHASNSIVKSLAGSAKDDDPTVTLNTSGKTTVSGVVSMSKLIAKHINPIPPLIYGLFRSVIGARSAHYTMYQQTIANDPDPKVEKSNKSHKYFIDALTEAFKALGGDTWELNSKSGSEKPSDGATIEEVIFSNRFSSLNLNEKEGDEDKTEANAESGQQTPAMASTQGPRKQPKPGKGKKGKNAKKPKKQKAATVQDPDLDDVPLESYRIIEDEDGITTEYLMAVYAIWRDWAELRLLIQNTWREVAYDGLNSAVAGELSNLAVAMIKQTESAIFVEFPGHDSYETVMQTITRGNVDKAQGMFTLSLHTINPNATKDSKRNPVLEVELDLKEQLMIHTYQNLLDFVTDYQKTRSGKPTKSLMTEIRDWNPNFNLQRATKEQRLSWRRSYTINWLYDLVNLYSAIIVQRNAKGEKHVYERVDWSPTGPWHIHRRIFGLDEFAGFVTSLAMQKPGTDVRKRILPHHVFQLQCIVDSLTVSRGWSINSLRGHVLETPARGFRPRRDVDLFLDRENEKFAQGFLQGVDILKQFFERDGALQGNPDRHNLHFGVLESLQDDFINWLGMSKYKYGLNSIPPSRFSDTDSNGLWEYSPFLCGVGLMEGLEYAYIVGMYIWDKVPEAMMLVHLHNMLVKKGYINEPVGVYASLEDIFPTAFFADGKAPSSDFHEALIEASKASRGGRYSAKISERSILSIARSSVEINEIVNPEKNQFFKAKPLPLTYREASWNLDRIPEKDITVGSLLCFLRIARTKQLVDPITGKRRLEDTDLVCRLRATGTDDETLIGISQTLYKLGAHANLPLPERYKRSVVAEGYTLGPVSDLNKRAGTTLLSNGSPYEVSLTARELLELVKWDIYSEVCGHRPVLSFNYIWAMANFMMTFTKIEDELKRVRNPLYIRIYETRNPLSSEKRVGLTMLAMAEQDDECLRVMANMFQRPRTGFMGHIYWNDLEGTSDMMEKSAQRDARREKEFGPDQCAVM